MIRLIGTSMERHNKPAKVGDESFAECRQPQHRVQVPVASPLAPEPVGARYSGGLGLARRERLRHVSPSMRQIVSREFAIRAAIARRSRLPLVYTSRVGSADSLHQQMIGRRAFCSGRSSSPATSSVSLAGSSRHI